MANRVRSTELYGHIYPLMMTHDNCYLERICFRPDCVVFRSLDPNARQMVYTYQRHGLDNPSQDTLYALAQAAIIDMHRLRDSHHYTFCTHTTVTATGEKIHWYEYEITSPWKSHVIAEQAERLRLQQFGQI